LTCGEWQPLKRYFFTILGRESSHKPAVLFTGWSVLLSIGMAFLKQHVSRTVSVLATRHSGPDSVGFLEKSYSVTVSKTVGAFTPDNGNLQYPKRCLKKHKTIGSVKNGSPACETPLPEKFRLHFIREFE